MTQLARSVLVCRTRSLPAPLDANRAVMVTGPLHATTLDDEVSVICAGSATTVMAGLVPVRPLPLAVTV